MALEDVKFVVYVSKSKWGRWPGSAFAGAAQDMAVREEVTGAMLDDGANILHVIEGTQQAVDRFMAFVLLNNRLVATRVIHETERHARMFEGQPLLYCFDESWRPKIAALVAGGPVHRRDIQEVCLRLSARVESRFRVA